MKKRCIKGVMILLSCIVMLTACGEKNTEDADLALFAGEWKCENTPLNNEDYYTGFIVMHIQENGSFRMFDAEAGNPVISGSLEILSDKKLVLKCSTEEDFDPPPTWQSMSEKQEIVYSFTEDGKLHMTYQEGDSISTLVFVKQ